MTTDFQTALSKIKSQQDHLEKSGEKEVRNIVITPLLLSVGWDAFDHEEVWNEKPLRDDGFVDYGLKPTRQEFKVDYSLEINGESLVFMEVKQWSQNQKLTDANRDQLFLYCAAAGKDEPKLAVLTNGLNWRFYIAPVPSYPRLRQFFPELDIVNDEPNKVEEHFRQFLARDRIEKINKTLRAAHMLHRGVIESTKVRNKLSNAWNKLVSSVREQDKLLSLFAQNHDIEAEQEHLQDFIKLSGPLFNPVTVTPKKIYSRPISFTFRANGIEEIIPVTKWAHLNLKVCKLMYARHPNTFSNTVLNISKYWFSKSPENGNDYSPIGGSGIYVKTTGVSAKTAKDNCRKIVTNLGHPKDALTFQEA